MQFEYHTGIQRVIRETHEHLFDFLSCHGIQLGWCRTQDTAASNIFLNNDYLAADPVLRNGEVPLGECPVVIFLDLNTSIDFSRLATEKKESGKTYIFMIHDLLPIQISSVPPQASFQFRIYLQQVLHLADHIVVTTEKVRNDLLDLSWHTKAEIHIIHLGTSLPTQTSVAIPRQQISLMYVSTIEPRKGHDLLLDTFDLLLESGIDVDLNLIGRYGWDREQLQARILGHAEFGSRLRWRSSADDYELRAVARKCNIGVFPTEDEGFGLFVEEGLSLGLNMVVSDIPEFRERAGSGVYFSGTDPAELAARIIEAREEWGSADSMRQVRSMQDFAHDLTTLILAEVEKRKVTCV